MLRCYILDIISDKTKFKELNKDVTKKCGENLQKLLKRLKKNNALKPINL